MDLIKAAEREFAKESNYPSFHSGDTITVHYKIREGNKERIQQFRGVVLQRRGSGISETFTVRKLSGNIGVERIFPISSPFIDRIDINKKGHVRRARIFYLRGRTGKKARIQEKRIIGSAGNNKNGAPEVSAPEITTENGE
jgi:large subunit ribosomal protein L19